MRFRTNLDIWPQPNCQVYRLVCVYVCAHELAHSLFVQVRSQMRFASLSPHHFPLLNAH